MWTLIKLIDAILLIYFIVIGFAVPLLDAQTVLPSSIFPEVLVNFKNWFTYDFGNYLLSEKPRFFIGIAWLELLFVWPLSIASIYAIITGKSWLTITCLSYGVYFFTALVAILSELMGSGKASKRLLYFYYIFVAFSVLAILRGLLPLSQNSDAYDTQPPLVMKKRA